MVEVALDPGIDVAPFRDVATLRPTHELYRHAEHVTEGQGCEEPLAGARRGSRAIMLARGQLGPTAPLPFEAARSSSPSRYAFATGP
jgi:hypothetical protein